MTNPGEGVGQADGGISNWHISGALAKATVGGGTRRMAGLVAVAFPDLQPLHQIHPKKVLEGERIVAEGHAGGISNDFEAGKDDISRIIFKNEYYEIAQKIAASAAVLRNCAEWLTLWRRARDSNPRYPFRYNGFQDRRFQPLTQLSASGDCPMPVYRRRRNEPERGLSASAAPGAIVDI